MNRYARTFAALAARKEMAFIPFAMAGDPDRATSERIFKTYLDNGADILEIGYPFSDPIADGPANQKAAQRATDAGMSPARFFSLVSRLRRYAPDTPFGVLCYANTLFRYGYDAFCKKASHTGIDSLLVVDCPPHEAPQLYTAIRQYGLCPVFIVSELTPDARIRHIVRSARGFLYIVSRLGPTGTDTAMHRSVGTTLSRVRGFTDLPLCVGFGISTPAHIRSVRHAGADGAIVGSALVRLIEEHTDTDALLSTIADRVRRYKRATRAPRTVPARS
jgi:tryptophan synthase alpha chain